ncbi:MAG: DUF2752 domain-containing protein [Verrucomicrobiia bacterium]
MKNLCGSSKVLGFKIENSARLYSKKKTGVIVISISLVGLVLFSLFYYYYGAMLMRFIPPCLLYTVIGIECPVCGSQRAIYSLLHGNVAEALKLNGFIVLALIIGIILYFKLITDYYFKNKPIRVKLYWIYALVVFAILFTIFRNL